MSYVCDWCVCSQPLVDTRGTAALCASLFNREGCCLEMFLVFLATLVTLCLSNGTFSIFYTHLPVKYTNQFFLLIN